MPLQSQPRRPRAVAASNVNANYDDVNGADYYDDDNGGVAFNDGVAYNTVDKDNSNGNNNANANANAVGLAALLPAPMRGRPVAEDRAQGRGPYELESPAELDNLMSTADNAVVYFYKPECPYCKQFAPVYADLAADVHRTNRGSPAASILGMAPVPIVMAKIDGARHREGINALRDGFLGPKYGRGYPTVLFKRGADKVGVTWDSSKPREREAIASLMAKFYGDPTLAPMDPARLAQTMRNPNPEFIYFGSDNIELVPRFVRAIDPSYVDIEDALATLGLLFAVDAPLAARGAFYPANRADRADIALPSIAVIGEGGVAANDNGNNGDDSNVTTYANRDAHRWAAVALADQLGIAPPTANQAVGPALAEWDGLANAPSLSAAEAPRRTRTRAPRANADRLFGERPVASAPASRRRVTFAG
ncbi:Disulfide isomerase [Pandoravirus quercus]|uniref:Disulfide isomerase n=1 Tax=Pandoravirus quercus TaxID=2107709 RepID=A0A2U7U8R9_9VIRU|nr:Disulfide isomerase [Pandoravirus quercus]AVK74826.1 Disulfide isomerase [Pandoravirus quercus]